MADDNRLPTNQSQLDIKAELTAIKTAIQQLYAMQNKTDLTTIAPAENQIASAAHAVDDIFTYNGKLYQVTSAIDIGDDITNKITEIATTSYVNPTRMNHIEDGIASADLTNGGTIDGNLDVKKTGNYSVIGVGKGTNSSENGIIQFRDKNMHFVNLSPVDNLGDDRYLRLPGESGTLITTNQLYNPTGVALEAIFNSFNVLGYSDVPVSGLKIYAPNNTSRYMIIGFVTGGSNLYSVPLIYTSMNDTWKRLDQ